MIYCGYLLIDKFRNSFKTGFVHYQSDFFVDNFKTLQGRRFMRKKSIWFYWGVSQTNNGASTVEFGNVYYVWNSVYWTNKFANGFPCWVFESFLNQSARFAYLWRKECDLEFITISKLSTVMTHHFPCVQILFINTNAVGMDTWIHFSLRNFLQKLYTVIKSHNVIKAGSFNISIPDSVEVKIII